jgi:hypothetical protein
MVNTGAMTELLDALPVLLDVVDAAEGYVNQPDPRESTAEYAALRKAPQLIQKTV